MVFIAALVCSIRILYNVIAIVYIVIRHKVSSSHIIVGTPEAVHYWMTKLQAFQPSSISFLVLDDSNVLLESQKSWESSVGIYM